MNTTTRKKKGRLAGRPKQSPPAKAETVDGNPIPLSDKDKDILFAAQKAVAKCLGCTWAVTTAAVGHDPRQLVIAATALSNSLRRANRLARAVGAVGARIKREVRR